MRMNKTREKDYYEFIGQTKFISGTRAMEHIPYELGGFDAGKPLVLMSSASRAKGLGKKFLNALYDSNMIVGALYDRVPPYSSVGVIHDLAVLFRDRGCDSVIALGDAAVVDTAKGVNMLVSTGAENLMDFAGENRIPKRLKPSVVVPACGATGFEVADRAMIEGRAFVSGFLFPDLVCVDGRMVISAPPEDVAGAALVALAHCVEACAFPHNNPMTDMYAYSALQFLFEHMRRLPRTPGTKGCIALANAFAMAGIAFSNAPAGIVHHLGMALADETNIPASTAMGILLPHYLDYKTAVMKQEIREELLIALAGIDAYCATPENERQAKAVALVKGLLKGMKGIVPQTLAELHVPAYKLKSAAALASELSGGRIDQRSCMTILEHAQSGAPIKPEGNAK
jgi:alcohol dehydrogenase